MNVLTHAVTLMVLCAAAGWCVAQEAAAEPSGSSPARVDEILTNLQARSDGLADIRCKVRFVEKDEINLTTKTSYGQILFLIMQPNPRFLIHFEKSEVDGMMRKQEWYLFDGRWLWQGVERLRQVDQQEIVREGEKVDLFDLESAPFPLPFGQKKDKILRNFEVSLMPPAPGDPPETDHLVCVPKPDSRLARQYDKLEFFVKKGLHLPCRVVVTKNNQYETNTADFPGLSEKSINAGVTEKDFAHPKVWKKEKYTFEEERLPPQSEAKP